MNVNACIKSTGCPFTWIKKTWKRKVWLKAMSCSKEPALEMEQRPLRTRTMKTSSITIYSTVKSVSKNVQMMRNARPLGSMVAKVKKILNGALPGTMKMLKVTRRAFLMLIYPVLLKQVISKSNCIVQKQQTQQVIWINISEMLIME